jgi:hypothetical protein
MDGRLPQFRPTVVHSKYFWLGDRAFLWQAGDRLSCWIVLSPSLHHQDEFNVYLGWSRLGRFPELLIVPSPDEPTPDRTEFVHEEYLTRLPRVCSANDVPWRFDTQIELIDDDDVVMAIELLVDDAMQLLELDGIPYFEALQGSTNA